MTTPLDDLRDALRHAQIEFEAARMIDNFERMKAEREYWASEMRRLTGEIWKLERARAH